jgi:hypothetical protein
MHRIPDRQKGPYPQNVNTDGTLTCIRQRPSPPPLYLDGRRQVIDPPLLSMAATGRMLNPTNRVGDRKYAILY